MISMTKLLADAKVEAGTLTAEIPDDWMQGRSLFGGLQVALALRAMRNLVPDVVLRTLQATFVAPVPDGRVTVRAKVLRSGKSATHVEARIVDPGDSGGEVTLALVIGVFGAARSSAAEVRPVQPEVVPGKVIELHHVPGVTASFGQHFTVKWLRGRLPFSGDRGLSHVLEIAMHDDGTATEAHVVSIADFIPPIAMSHLTTPSPGSTLTWMMEMLIDRVDQLPLTGWRIDAELIAARDGYTSQRVMVWGPGGVPVALSTQSMLVFS